MDKLSEKLPDIGNLVLLKFKAVNVYDSERDKDSLYTEYMVGKLESGTSVKDSKWVLSDLEYDYDPETHFDSWLYIKDIEDSCG